MTTIPIRWGKFRIAIHGTPPQLANALANTFQLDSDPHPAPVQITVGAPTALPDPRWQLLTVPSDPPLLAFRERDLVLSDGRHSFTVSSPARGYCGFDGTDMAEPTRCIRGLFSAGIAELLRPLGGYYLHAACLSRDDRTLLLCGLSGNGKSTHCLGLMRRGWRLTSDDSVIGWLEGDRVHVADLFGEISLRGPGADWLLRRGAKEKLDTGVANKRVFDARSLTDGYGELAVPSELIFLEWRPELPAATALAPVPIGEALAGLIRQNVAIFLDRNQTQAHLDFLLRLLHQAPPRVIRTAPGSDSLALIACANPGVSGLAPAGERYA